MFLKLKFPNIGKITCTFIISFLLFVNSGFYFNNFPVIAPVYLCFYIAILYLMAIIALKHSIKLPYQSLIGLIAVLYIFISQFFVEGKIIAIFGSTATFLFYIIGTIFLPQLSYKKNLFIANAILKYHIVIYGLDTLYRLAFVNFNIANMFYGLNFYTMKTTTLLYADTNTIGINTSILALFGLYLFNLTKNRSYIKYIIIYSVFNILSFSRASIFAEVLTLLLLLIMLSIKELWLKRKVKLPSFCISLKTMIVYIFLFAVTIASLFILIKIISYINYDPSFHTKIGAFNTFKTFILTAPLNDFLFGIGFNNGRLVEYGSTIAKAYAHTYLLTYFAETGLCGFLLVSSFLLSILYKTHANLILLIPYSIFGISLIAHTQLHLFYALLAFIWYFEKFRKWSKLCQR